jgi:hypothetical protein
MTAEREQRGEAGVVVTMGTPRRPRHGHVRSAHDLKTRALSTRRNDTTETKKTIIIIEDERTKDDAPTA